VEAAGGVRVKDGRIPLGETGIPLGDAHHRCRVSDLMVATLRRLYEVENLELREIVRRTGVAYGTALKIIYYQRRNVVPREWRKVDYEGFAQALRGAEEAAGGDE
jgi:hypothetical protein